MLRALRRAPLLLAALLALAAGSAAAAPPLALPDGAAEPRVLIISFTDYQCPFCARAEATLAKLKAQWPADLQILTLHQPLPFHADARPAALAALAAARQQAFAPYHQALFAGQRQPGLAPDALTAYAKRLNLDLDRFARDVADPTLAAEVDRQVRIAEAVGATGTPTFFVNGVALRGAQPFDAFVELIAPELEAAEAADQRGVAWVRARTAEHNPTLADLVFAGAEPPTKAPAAALEPEADTTVFQATVSPEDAALGAPAADALVTAVAFVDYQCPFSARHQATLDALLARYSGQLRLVYKHLPLAFHKDAAPAAAAAICAQAQGQFPAMNARLFGNTQALSRADLVAHAAALGLDKQRFERCLKDKATAARVAADLDLAERVGAVGTPTTFINGRRINGARALEDFVNMVDEELELAQRHVDNGTPPAELYPRLMATAQAHVALSDAITAIDAGGAPRLGPASARAEVVVFTDYACAPCGQLAGVLDALVARYGARLSVAFKPAPSTSRGEPAAEAALCAHAQKKFAPLHALLVAHREDLDTVDLAALGAEAGLHRERFAACLADGAMKPAVASHRADARTAGVIGVPTVFVNGRRYAPEGPFTVDAFARVLDRVLAAPRKR